MTPQEAIEALKIRQIQIDGNAVRLAKFFEGLAEAYDALEKQIPKKPFDVSTPAAKWGLCPNCEGKTNMIGKSPNRVFENQKYCIDCGQALDWSDTE